MYATNFEYDNHYLSDFGFIVCDFNASSGANNVSVGSNITFNTVPTKNGKKFNLTSTQYEECIETRFDICKDPDLYDDKEITDNEFRKIMRWLNRNEFLKFHPINDNDMFDELFFNASFNIEKIKIRELIYGISVTMITDSPFAYGFEKKSKWHITSPATIYRIVDYSDEIGYTFPNVKIICNGTGDLILTNKTINKSTVIKNCTKGEVITIEGNSQIITSSLDQHKIYNDFNFEFFKIQNTINNRVNEITVSLPCDIEITYTPIIKNSI